LKQNGKNGESEMAIKACLIYPRDLNLNFFPLGLGYVGAFLKEKGHDVTFLDLTKHDMGLLSRLKSNPPDIAGLSITTPQLSLARTIIRAIRALLPTTKIVAGGIHPSYFKDRFIQENDVDFVVYGEGEHTMDELCRSLSGGDFSPIKGLVYKKGDRVVVNAPRELVSDLDSLPAPLREAVNYETYLQPPGLIRGLWTKRSANLSTSRGCPGRCTYCGVNYLWGDTYRRRSTDNVLREIDALVERYNVDGLYFMDDTFLMNERWVREFCEKLAARPYRLRWSCYGRIDSVTENMLGAIRGAGCVQVEYGIESCSDRILTAIDKKVTVRQIEDVVRMTKKTGLRVLGSFVMGLPEEDAQDLEQSIETASSLNLDFATCYFATPYPGSRLFERALAENRIEQTDLSKWYIRNAGIWKVNLDPDTLIKYRSQFLKKYRLRNILFFVKNPAFILRLMCLFAVNLGALSKAIFDSLKIRSPDDLGYFFYAHMTAGLNGRNKP
jgi:anaerobic magnesium-protoporphyrin IX monomethyl ester cyclase